jgi:acyl transferase domain-containing protein
VPPPRTPVAPPATGTPDLQASQEPGSAVAVIGLACRLPGADSAATFWNNLREGRSAITEVPRDRFELETWYSADPQAPSRTYCRFGGWLDDVDRFDAEFFRISRREAETMAPQQRLLLEVAWHALEDAGHAGARARAASTGVFVGIIPADYASSELLRQHPGARLQDMLIEPTIATGEAMSVVANRLSYAMDLSGPSIAVDTACSSSLVSVHLACQSLLAGESDLAIAAGVNVGITPGRFVAFSKARMFAPDGRCKTFDAGADGYVCGEGVGAVVLKRLDRARADGDRVLAVIRGSAVNQDGATNGLTAPSARAQQRVLEAAYRRAAVSPATVSLIEAHGTGTALGDPIEVRALQQVFGAATARRGFCAIGSVKSNIGHLEGSAGIASLIKVVLSLVHKEIPATLHFQRANRELDFSQSAFFVNDRRRSWPAGSNPRRAGISSFGFGGTNCHLVLEEAPPSEPAAEHDVAAAQLCTLAASTAPALEALVAHCQQHFSEMPEGEFADACWSLNTGRDALPHRFAAVASGPAQMASRLAARDGLAGQVLSGRRARVALMLTGQGAQYPGMGKGLYAGDVGFRGDFDRCAELLARSELDVPLAELVFGDDAQRLGETRYTQPATFVLDYCVGRLWLRLGLEPAALIGHSVGEYAAACLAGVMSLEEALRLVVLRGRLMQGAPGRGAMAAVLAPLAWVQEIVAATHGVEIGAVNGPNNVVVTGTQEGVDAVVARAQSERKVARALAVSHAFHSRLMEPILPAFAEILSAVRMSQPAIPIISNRTGALVTSDIATTDYWVGQLRSPVLFGPGIETLRQDGIDMFVEAGPGQTLAGLAREVLRAGAPAGASPSPAIAFSSLARGRDDRDSLLAAAGQLWVRGASLDLASIFGSAHRRRVAMPLYPFQRKRYWLTWEPLPTAARASARPAPQEIFSALSTPPARAAKTQLALSSE